jgi:hypothetical protein
VQALQRVRQKEVRRLQREGSDMSILSGLLGSKELLTYEDRSFKAKDRVYIAEYAGTMKPEETGHPNELDGDAGRTGTVLRKYQRSSGENWLLVIQWDAQEWRESQGGHKVRLGPFEDSIHPCYLKVSDGQPIPPPRLEFDGKVFVAGDRVQLTKSRFFSGDACGHPEVFGLDSCGDPLGMNGKAGQLGTFVRVHNDDARVDWDAQEWEECDTERKVHLPAFTCDVMPGAIEHHKRA